MLYVLCLVTQSCVTLCDPINCGPLGSTVHGDSPGKNTGVGCHALLEGIFPTQGSKPGLPHCRWILYRLSHQGSLLIYTSYWYIPPIDIYLLLTYTSYWYTPIQMAKIQKTDNTNSAGDTSEGILFHCWWKCKMVQPARKTIWLLITRLNAVWSSSHLTPRYSPNLF